MLYGESQQRILYGQTDPMGYCYYGNYPLFYEIGRCETMRNYGFSYSELENNGYIMPVVSMHIDYKKPAHYDEIITIKTFVRERPNVKIVLEHEIYNHNGELLNKGNTTLCFVNRSTNRPSPAPDYVQKIFDENF